MKKDLYICDTYYHLLIAIIKNIKNFGKNDLLIAAELENNHLANNTKIIKKLNDKKIFNSIKIFDYSKEQIRIRNSKFYYIKYYSLLKKIKINCPISFNDYNEIYMFYDLGLYGRLINYMKIYYNLIEDGTDCFKNNSKHWPSKKNIFSFIKNKIFNFCGMGQSKYVKTIEVNNKDGIYICQNKLIEMPKSKLFLDLSKKEKQEIFDIFVDNFNLNDLIDSSILLTQPFYQDKILDSELQQVNMYIKIIESYMKNEKVIIKMHPREKVNYKKYIKNVMIIDDIFPLEILSFFDNVKFKKIVTISSTAINFINNVDEKKVLGWEWLDNYKEEIK